MSLQLYPEPRRFTSADVPANIPGIIFHARRGDDIIGVQWCDEHQHTRILKPCGGFDEMTVEDIHKKYQRRLYANLEVYSGMCRDNRGDIPVERFAYWVHAPALLSVLRAEVA